MDSTFIYDEITRLLRKVAAFEGVALCAGKATITLQDGNCVAVVLLPRASRELSNEGDGEDEGVAADIDRIVVLSKRLVDGSAPDVQNGQFEYKLTKGTVTHVRLSFAFRKEKTAAATDWPG